MFVQTLEMVTSQHNQSLSQYVLAQTGAQG
jgi:hypothetical protein